jgi:transposase
VVAKKQPFVGPKQPGSTQAVGIDLGLKDFLTTSEGLKVGAMKFCRDLEPALASAQRAHKKQRKDAFHKLSTALVI